ncbi:hypothetical protein [Marinimicrobium sp. ABcell2]|uniref:hypothetical protein n=1 Tax=Marinimicrobium sp. ABcell2 TaxID=3069751 RepID=UPI0027B6E5C6|nr:hypothetical protein [Marinimicrobium sp. ABcell2]MDQ2077390.1 hypothetical protein [Marinimicrobium sp. ABcell2]
MKPFKYAVPALAVAALLISGCQSQPQSQDGPRGPNSERTAQRYEVMAPARTVNSEEAVNFIRAQSELDRTRQYTGGTEFMDGPNNHPAFVGGGGQTFTALTIRERETLLSVANRVMNMASFTRLIYDLSDEAPSPDMVQARMRVATIGGPTLFGEIAATYVDQFPGLQLFAAQDGDGHALVISDKGYPRWSRLVIHDVQPGLLKDNVAGLARSLGWSMPDHLWTTDDFKISSGYPVVIEPDNPRQAITSLMSRYPAQAQLNPNTRTITVVPRLRP